MYLNSLESEKSHNKKPIDKAVLVDDKRNTEDTGSLAKYFGTGILAFGLTILELALIYKNK